MSIFEHFRSKSAAKHEASRIELEKAIQGYGDAQRSVTEAYVQRERALARLKNLDLLREKEGLRLRLRLEQSKQESERNQTFIDTAMARIAKIDAAIESAENDAERNART
jgi:hypothetical protein